MQWSETREGYAKRLIRFESLSLVVLMATGIKAGEAGERVP